ncbi:MAG: tRNA (adenosine(37)-N6)-threonylcarbamoyltransferase complex transferase subunit TsaD [Candidatus Omnitrophica bacterium]|nr:tRNA (adenosine(37)-N6)-threonylcarbamoyltransferase complex transferase subunit TsaD [Candidatus Omnitrophota bacterium]
MNILGIETSCDETSAAIVKDGKDVLSCETNSSLKFHAKYGGIVPEIASRMQLETISYVVDAAVKESRLKLKDLNAVCVTDKPGLLGSLLVGIAFAKAMSFSLDLPLLGVNHLHSHIYAPFLNNRNIKFPFIALIVSGGHTSLFYLKDFNQIEPLGSTLDDACGEAFDKVAKILGLGYPGGPQIENIAKKGDPKKFSFACSNTKNPLDFSFSGIKTAVLYLVHRTPDTMLRTKKADIAASFQQAVFDTLIKKSFLACKIKKVKKLVIGGGVVANNRLRESFSLQAKENNMEVFFPSRELSMDNAAMVAGLGFHLLRKGQSSDLTLTA